ncbi:MAG: response regulator [Candidatus Latescibacterota bacterium]
MIRRGYGHSIKLLLVDDEEDFLESMSSALLRRKITVTPARNGREALELLELNTYDVAVVDLKMPVMTGEALFKEIKKKLPNLPVIIVTGHGTHKQVGEFSKQGVYYYLAKPCDVESLAELARQSVDSEWQKWRRRLNFY